CRSGAYSCSCSCSLAKPYPLGGGWCSNLLQQLRRQLLCVLARPLHKTLPWCCRSKIENLSANFHDRFIDNGEHSHGLIAVRIQQPQKLALRPQSQPRVKIVDRIDNLSELFVS